MAESSPSSAMTARSDTELEEMLDRMLIRLALCDDSNLQALLSKLLPPAISSLSSPSSAVRNKDATSQRPDVIGTCYSTNGLSSSSSPDSRLLWFDKIENILMKDDEDGRVFGGGIRANLSQEFFDRFLADVLVDSLGDGSAEIADESGDKEEPGSSDDGWVEAAKVDGANGGSEAYDPASKKLRRQLRNRDAAVRSRERGRKRMSEIWR